MSYVSGMTGNARAVHTPVHTSGNP
jgi:hypothetical protein